MVELTAPMMGQEMVGEAVSWQVLSSRGMYALHKSVRENCVDSFQYSRSLSLTSLELQVKLLTRLKFLIGCDCVEG